MKAIGIHSMTYLVIHDPILIVLQAVCDFIGIDYPIVVFLIMVVSLSVILPFAAIFFSAKKYKWAIGE